jgi:hypothetical protein
VANTIQTYVKSKHFKTLLKVEFKLKIKLLNILLGPSKHVLVIRNIGLVNRKIGLVNRKTISRFFSMMPFVHRSSYRVFYGGEGRGCKGYVYEHSG